jgi:protein TonB
VRRRLTVWLLISLAIHAGLASATLAGLRGAMPPMLFIDMMHGLLVPDEPAVSGRDGRGAGAPPAAPAASPPTRSRIARGERRDVSPPPPPAPAPRESPADTPLVLTPPTPRPSAVPERTPTVLETSPAPVAPPTVVAPPAAASRTVESGAPSATAPPTETPPGDGDGASAAAPPAGESGTGQGQRAAGAGTAPTGRSSASDGAAGPGRGARDGTAVTLAIPGGGGGGDAAEYDGYYALVRRRVLESLTYPLAARRWSLTGTVELDLEIQPTGVISRVDVVASSSHRVLDDAAVDTVRRVGRVPFPPNVRPRPLRMQLPVVFVLR